MRFVVILFIQTIFTLHLVSHDYRNDSKNIYKRPVEVITAEKLNEINAAGAESTGTENVQIEKIKSALNEYYGQFVQDKLILDSREKSGRFPTNEYNADSGLIHKNANVNSIRLFIAGTRFKNTESHLARDSDLLFGLHLKLAKLYQSVNEKHKAVESYLAGLRYRDFSNTEERYFDENLLEELGQEEANRRLAHKKIKTELEDVKKELKKAIDNKNLIGSRYAKAELPKDEADSALAKNQENIEALKENVKAKESEYSDSMLNNFGNYISQKTLEDSNTVLEFAKLIKEVETQNKERENVENRSTQYGKGIFVAANTNRNQDFTGFAQLLEFALKINGNNSEAISLLAEEYKSSGKKRNAIDLYLKYIRLANLPENKGKLPVYDVYKNIAQLYTELKQYVVASNYYEKMSEIQKVNNNEEPDFYYQLGDFYIHKLGNAERASENFTNWLTWLDQKRKEEQEKREKDKDFGISLEETTKRLSFEFTASQSIAKYHKQMQYPEKESIYLERAYKTYKEMHSLMKEYENFVADAKRDVDLLKRDLLTKSTSDSLTMYKDEQEKLEEVNNQLKSIRIFYDSLRKTNLLFRLSAFEEENRNYKRVRFLYEEIINIGNENEVANALRNIERVKKMEADGITRRRIVH